MYDDSDGNPFLDALSGMTGMLGGDGGMPMMQGSPDALSPDKGEMLQQLKSAAEQAFPNNPTMQQVAITQAIHESGLMGTPSKLAPQNNLFGIKAPGTAGTLAKPRRENSEGGNRKTNARGAPNNNGVQTSKLCRDRQ